MGLGAGPKALPSIELKQICICGRSGPENDASPITHCAGAVSYGELAFPIPDTFRIKLAGKPLKG